MDIGILTTTFPQHELDVVLDACVAHGIRRLQFDLGAAGLESLPDAIRDEDARRIRREIDARSMCIDAVSGTFNMAHPDATVRTDGLRRLRALCTACGSLGTGVITLCTGTRNTESMWRPHPDNRTPEVWADMRATMLHAVRIAEEHGVVLAFEPEVNNVVDSAAAARRILDEVSSPLLKVVMDGANIFHAGELPRMGEILREAFELLGADIALAHAKDLDHDGDAGHLPAGHGLLDYALYLQLLRDHEYGGPLVLHGLAPSQIDGCVAFLRGNAR